MKRRGDLVAWIIIKGIDMGAKVRRGRDQTSTIRFTKIRPLPNNLNS
jgi:hypothetical protein